MIADATQLGATIACLSAVCLLLSFASNSRAEPSIDRQALEAFVDGVVTTSMQDHQIPGVVVSIIAGDEIVLEKGYGYAREPIRRAVDPQRTLFRVASISKTFNATALMQLVERGVVTLDATLDEVLPDVDWDLPYGPVRVRDLLTHSAGFEDSILGHFHAADLETDYTLDDYVCRFQPAQVRPPGGLIVYSNYGTVVIGLIVERLSGQPYPDYMEQNVLGPLGMHASAFRDWSGEPRDGYLSELDEARLAHAYRWLDGRYVGGQTLWQHRAAMPAAGLVTTAGDMSRWMLAHLNGGANEAGRVLAPATVATMHEIIARNHPSVNGNAHGFWAGDIFGHATLEHSGSIFGFLSNMVLLPELDAGIFVATNSPTGWRLSATLPRHVVAHLYGASAPPEPPEFDSAAAIDEALDDYRGEYQALRRGYTTALKIIVALEGNRVDFNDQGYLTVTSGGATRRYVGIADDVFENVDTGSRLAFERDADGRPYRIYSGYGANVFDRVGPLATGRFLFVIAGLVVIASGARLIGAWLRRRNREPESNGERLARYASFAIALAWLAAIAAIAVDLSGAYAPQAPHLARFPTDIGWIWVIAGIVGAALSAIMAVALGPVWRHRSWPFWLRIRYTAFTILSVAFAGLLEYWNLLGVRTLG